MNAWGIQLPKEEVRSDEDDEARFFELWEENWPAAEMFLKCSTQWVPAGMGGIVGLSYPGVQVVLSMYNACDPEIFSGIQTMELAALGVINRASK